MTHWYREPKRVKLMEYLQHAGINFVLSSDWFAESELLKLRAAVPAPLAQRLMLGATAAADTKKVLVIAPRSYPDPSCLQNPESWAGVFVLPADPRPKEEALKAIFVINRSFKNGARGQRPIGMGGIHRFVLDMRPFPPSLYRIREVDGAKSISSGSDDLHRQPHSS
jgi:hypothetical protein